MAMGPYTSGGPSARPQIPLFARNDKSIGESALRQAQDERRTG
jgi:hypothetical protein